MKNHLLLLIATVLLCPSVASAQFNTTPTGKGVGLGEAKVMQFRAGVTVQALGGTCRALLATVPVPTEWPEQEVKIVGEDTTVQVKRVRYRDSKNQFRQMIVEIPVLAAGQEARAIITFEVTRRAILAPPDTNIFVIPKRLTRDLKLLTGPSPFIESRHTQIISLAKEVTADKENDWKKVEAIYDHVQKVLEYEQDAPLKGAIKALREGKGDCEDYTSLFVAMCRAKKIPARTVWVAGHSYPEFYLQDDEGAGHWIPCQSSGTRAFGEMPQQLPILQKGDNFRDPERPKQKQRYVSPFLTGRPSKNGGKPRVRFIQELVQ